MDKLDTIADGQRKAMTSREAELFKREYPHGYFKGSVRTSWCDDDRSMVLLDEFAYYDPSGRRWLAEAGVVSTLIDGASIPWFFRRVFPCYIGAYRRASVIHDAFCTYRTRPSNEVHEVFYWATRLGMDYHLPADRDSIRGVWRVAVKGLHAIQAWLMWVAVRVYGPRFDEDRHATVVTSLMRTGVHLLICGIACVAVTLLCMWLGA